MKGPAPKRHHNGWVLHGDAPQWQVHILEQGEPRWKLVEKVVDRLHREQAVTPKEEPFPCSPNDAPYALWDPKQTG